MVFKRCSIGTKRPKVCQENISPTSLHHQHQPEPLRQSRMIHAFLFFTPNSDPTSECCSRNQDSSEQATFFNLLLSSFGDLCESYPPCAVLSWQERHPVWSSAAGAHLLQGSTCCVFRDGILQILVVTSGYLSYCCLSIISNQSVHSPLTSDINKTFSSTQLPFTGYFLFFGPFSVNPRDGCVWKSQ